jgi:hypothetical protein
MPWAQQNKDLEQTDKNYLKAPATKRPPQARTRSQRITGA